MKKCSKLVPVGAYLNNPAIQDICGLDEDHLGLCIASTFVCNRGHNIYRWYNNDGIGIAPCVICHEEDINKLINIFESLSKYYETFMGIKYLINSKIQIIKSYIKLD